MTILDIPDDALVILESYLNKNVTYHIIKQYLTYDNMIIDIPILLTFKNHPFKNPRNKLLTDDIRYTFCNLVSDNYKNNIPYPISIINNKFEDSNNLTISILIKDDDFDDYDGKIQFIIDSCYNRVTQYYCITEKGNNRWYLVDDFYCSVRIDELEFYY